MTLHTFTGRDLNPLAPDSTDIAIEDIAHSLALQCRFAGHVREFYSVAQHSVVVSYLCEPADALHGLLHDASEAYLVDVPRPVKNRAVMDGYRACEALLQAAIYRRFGLNPVIPESVHRADDAILVNEAQDLFAAESVPEWAVKGTRLPLRGRKLEAWSAKTAETRFLARFNELMTGPARRESL